jgi:hypothetical protein
MKEVCDGTIQMCQSPLKCSAHGGICQDQIQRRKKRMAAYQQHPPYAVQVELTEGCNLRCSFCGLSGIRGDDNDFRFMTLNTAEQIARELAAAKWNSRIEFAMHGEPTMNPDANEIVAIFRQHLPKAKLMMTSNGGGLMVNPMKRIQLLFAAGLDTLALDEYQDIGLVPKIKIGLMQDIPGVALEDIRKIGDLYFHHYPADPEGNPHQRKNTKRLVFIAPIDVSTKGTHATLNNHASSGAPPNSNADGKRCAKPFRELSFRWDGSVAICCNDWRGEYPIGNIHDIGLLDIWHHTRFTAMRRLLYHGIRDTGPCLGCDATSYRPGLLPDPKGKEDMALAEGRYNTDEEFNAINQAISEGPLTEPVLREWEVELIDD